MCKPKLSSSRRQFTRSRWSVVAPVRDCWASATLPSRSSVRRLSPFFAPVTRLMRSFPCWVYANRYEAQVERNIEVVRYSGTVGAGSSLEGGACAATAWATSTVATTSIKNGKSSQISASKRGSPWRRFCVRWLRRLSPNKMARALVV